MSTLVPKSLVASGSHGSTGSPPGKDSPPGNVRATLPLWLDRCWRRKTLVLLSGVAGALAGWLFASQWPSYSVKFAISREVSALELGGQAQRWNPLLLPWGQSALLEQIELEPEQHPGLKLKHAASNAGLEAEVSGRDPARVSGWVVQAGQAAVASANRAFSNQVERARSILHERRRSVDQDLDSSATALVKLQNEAGAIPLDQDATAALANLAAQEKELEEARQAMTRLHSQIGAIAPVLVRVSPELTRAREKLAEARLTMTDENPKVKGLIEAVAEAERKQRSTANSDISSPPSESEGVVGKMYLSIVDLREKQASLRSQIQQLERRNQASRDNLGGVHGMQVEFARLKGRYQALQQEQRNLVEQEGDLTWIAATASSAYRMFPLHPRARLTHWGGGLGRGFWSAFGFAAATIASAASLMFRQSRGTKVTTLGDLADASGLPLLGELPEDVQTNTGRREIWAATMLSRLRACAAIEGNQALLVGWASSRADDGRSQWIRPLVDAATRQGYRVLVISPRAKAGKSEYFSPAMEGTASRESSLESGWCGPLATSVDRWKSGAGWGSEGRTAWSEAIRAWKSTPNLVVLVEFPRASVADVAVLSEGLPIGVWLCPRNRVFAKEVSMNTQMFRESNPCRWYAALTHPRRSSALSGWDRWRRKFAFLLSLVWMMGLASGQEAGNQAATTVEVSKPLADFENTRPAGAFSITSPSDLAGWQKKLTLGSGDVLNLSLYENLDSLRPGVVIGPDGRINFLEAKGVTAAGKSVDELRTHLEEILTKFHRSPRVIVSPVSFQSKRYYVLGHVVQKGIYPLSQPTTVHEAVARARGFESTVVQGNTLVTADLSKSFIVRREEDGKFTRLEIDLEALFMRGDLLQNKALAPDDYLYFAPLDSQEVYVVGEVNSQGAMPFSPEMTALQAIATRGGFTDRAWRQKVLVVRGSFSQPRTFVLNVADVLSGKMHDFKLEPRDIVYVSRKPWAKAQELLESAATGFANAVIISWTGLNVKPIINEPIF